eukprot:4972962-Pleurochrysis_carterae.AAC.3
MTPIHIQALGTAVQGLVLRPTSSVHAESHMLLRQPSSIAGGIRINGARRLRSLCLLSSSSCSYRHGHNTRSRDLGASCTECMGRVIYRSSMPVHCHSHRLPPRTKHFMI